MNQKTFILIILIASACNLMAGDDKEEAKKGGRTTELPAFSDSVSASSALLLAIKTPKGSAPFCFGSFSPTPYVVSDAARFSPVSYDPFDPSNCRRGQ